MEEKEVCNNECNGAADISMCIEMCLQLRGIPIEEIENILRDNYTTTTSDYDDEDDVEKENNNENFDNITKLKQNINRNKKEEINRFRKKENNIEDSNLKSFSSKKRINIGLIQRVSLLVHKVRTEIPFSKRIYRLIWGGSFIVSYFLILIGTNMHNSLFVNLSVLSLLIGIISVSLSFIKK